MFELTIEIVAVLFLTAMAAGFIDSIAGGGGLITVPVLMLAGLTPEQALATNKVQASFGAGTAALSYARNGLVDLRSQWRTALIAFAAGVAGAAMVTWLPTQALRVMLPVILLAIAAFFAFRKGLDDSDRAQRMTPALFALTIVPAVGFYDGLIGPGAGAFYMLGFVLLAGYGILKATAHTKLLNFASNLGGLAAFALTGHPMWLVGLVMIPAQILGATLGSRMAMRVGAKVIKPLLVVTSTALALRLLWQMA
ncbi:TSUP family transporter [Paracoccus sp. Z118]|uniref:TSUP family transporter n=1 Tax=Paracoccus sp. Z118 TaxID=2851017 RepID=UPI001C2C0F6D|nr:TSUP family transporter [Paracoccus sp. Z118]MBV0892674.1 TSUP family transporter [Paracoccus sp. Z118]